MFKIELDFIDFVKYLNIGYKDDIYELIEYEYRSIDINDIKYCIPDKFEHLNSVIDTDTEVCQAIEYAINRAEEQAYYDEIYRLQKNEVYHFINKIEEFMNINIKVSNSIVTISGNIDDIKNKIIEVIDGEGYFYGQSCSEGYSDIDFIKNHLHYLLNIKLINDIYGVWNYASIEIDDKYAVYSIDNDYFIECINDELNNIGYKEQLRLL